MTAKKRIVGIEALRVVSMLMIVMLHVLGNGGVLHAAQRGMAQYYFAWGMEAFAYPAVDTFALVSGYVGYRGRHRLSALARLCLMAVFFDFVVTGIAVALGANLGLKQLLGSLFPPLIGRYWYLTCYACVYPFMPLLDKAVSELTEKKSRLVMATLFLFLCIAPTLVHNDFAGTKRGYSCAWLAALYVVGACVRRHNWLHNLKGFRGCVLYVASSSMVLLSRVVLEAITTRLLGHAAGGKLLYSYDSPLVVIAALGLLAWFSDEHMLEDRARIVTFLSSSSFAVFVLHGVPVFYDGPLKGGFAWTVGLSPLFMCGVCIAACVVIYVTCCLLDKMRELLFGAIGINRMLSSLDDQGLRII